MRLLRGLDHRPVSRDDLRTDQLVDRQTPAPGHPADAAAQCEAADPNGRRVTRADGQSVIGEPRGHLAPRRSSPDTHRRAVDGGTAERRELDLHTRLLCHRPRSMPTGDDGHGKIVVPRVLHGGDDAGGVSRGEDGSLGHEA